MAVDMLGKLPDELIIQIFDHLDVNKDFINLVLCGSRYNRLATPVLYSTFVEDGNSIRTSQFLSTIMARPDLALYVNTFTSSGPHKHIGEGKTALFNGYCAGPRLNAVLEKVWPEHNMTEIWEDKLRESDYEEAWEAIIALFMLLLPNLSTLRIPGYFDMEWKQEPRFIVYVVFRAISLQATNTPSPYSLSRLRNVDIILLTDEATMPLTAKAFLGLRSIRKIVSENNYRKNDIDTIPFQGVVPNVTHLKLKNSDMDFPLVFSNLLQPFCNLTHFTYSKYISPEPDYAFRPDQMRLGTLHLTSTLQELTIINHQEEVETFKYSVGEGEGEPFGSLVEFQRLRRLEASVSILVKIQKGTSRNATHSLDLFCDGEEIRFAKSLPDSLEELVLRVCFRNVFAVVEELFKRRLQGGLRKMRIVELVFADGFDLHDIEKEGAICATHGLSLGIAVNIRQGEDRWTEERLENSLFM